MTQEERFFFHENYLVTRLSRSNRVLYQYQDVHTLGVPRPQYRNVVRRQRASVDYQRASAIWFRAYSVVNSAKLFRSRNRLACKHHGGGARHPAKPPPTVRDFRGREVCSRFGLHRRCRSKSEWGCPLMAPINHCVYTLQPRNPTRRRSGDVIMAPVVQSDHNTPGASGEPAYCQAR